nr:p1=kDNA-binding protein {N-terminal} [Crithidia fasciculata, Peptide Mitochondrial Kinetoplast Partial, 15 aa] [Crithidia fasciculata]
DAPASAPRKAAAAKK